MSVSGCEARFSTMSFLTKKRKKKKSVPFPSFSSYGEDFEEVADWLCSAHCLTGTRFALRAPCFHSLFALTQDFDPQTQNDGLEAALIFPRDHVSVLQRLLSASSYKSGEEQLSIRRSESISQYCCHVI